MQRREVIKFAALTTVFWDLASASESEASLTTDGLLAKYEDSSDLLAMARTVREPIFHDRYVTEAQVFGAAFPSKRLLHETAYRLILASEVSSEVVYKAKYKSPVWPGGFSGVTIGIGYDLGDKTVDAFRAHWDGLLKEEQFLALRDVCRVSGEDAKIALANVSAVIVDWDSAKQQFERFLPTIMGETERVFPNCGKLSDQSFGALVSLVYNRGSNVSATNRRRREMFKIRELMKAEKFSSISKQIRRMKRLWRNEPAAKGLLIRRELEARLFEEGLP